jgi:hypothetical protein
MSDDDRIVSFDGFQDTETLVDQYLELNADDFREAGEQLANLTDAYAIAAKFREGIPVEQ